MSNIHLALPVPDEIDAARHQFLELHGSLAVMNTYLKIALACVSIVAMGLVFLLIKAHQSANKTEVRVVRISEIGRADAVNTTAGQYRPQEPEIKYFLIQFVHDHYGRIRSTLQQTFSRSLYYLDGHLADEIIERNRRTKVLEPYLAGQAEEIDVQVKNVAIEDLRTPPFRATVDYEKVYFTPSTRQELRRERFVGNFVFAVKEHVPNAMIPVNPLGLTITYFREDQAFQQVP